MRACPRLIFPPPLTRKRFLAPEWVFCLDIAFLSDRLKATRDNSRNAFGAIQSHCPVKYSMGTFLSKVLRHLARFADNFTLRIKRLFEAVAQILQAHIKVASRSPLEISF